MDGTEEKKDLKTEEINSMVPLMIFFSKLFICHSKNVESSPPLYAHHADNEGSGYFLKWFVPKSLSLDDDDGGKCMHGLDKGCSTPTQILSFLSSISPF